MEAKPSPTQSDGYPAEFMEAKPSPTQSEGYPAEFMEAKPSPTQSELKYRFEYSLISHGAEISLRTLAYIARS